MSAATEPETHEDGNQDASLKQANTNTTADAGLVLGVPRVGGIMSLPNERRTEMFNSAVLAEKQAFEAALEAKTSPPTAAETKRRTELTEMFKTLCRLQLKQASLVEKKAKARKDVKIDTVAAELKSVGDEIRSVTHSANGAETALYKDFKASGGNEYLAVSVANHHVLENKVRFGSFTRVAQTAALEWFLTVLLSSAVTDMVNCGENSLSFKVLLDTLEGTAQGIAPLVTTTKAYQRMFAEHVKTEKEKEIRKRQQTAARKAANRGKTNNSVINASSGVNGRAKATDEAPKKRVDKKPPHNVEIYIGTLFANIKHQQQQLRADVKTLLSDVVFELCMRLNKVYANTLSITGKNTIGVKMVTYDFSSLLVATGCSENFFKGFSDSVNNAVSCYEKKCGEKAERKKSEKTDA